MKKTRGQKNEKGQEAVRNVREKTKERRKGRLYEGREEVIL